MRALLSVYYKDGLIDFAKGLVDLGWELISSGGTATALREAGIKVIDVSEITGFPEMPGGLVKTLHPAIHGGILYDRVSPAQAEWLIQQSILPIDLVACNLYPFTTKPSVEMIDIGGPTMVRAAAKRHQNVTVVVDPADYDTVLDEFQRLNTTEEATRRRLARKAFDHTATYDAAIVDWLDEGELLPQTIHLTLQRSKQELSYGENRAQTPAALFSTGTDDPLAIDKFECIEGAAPSHNNYADLDRLLQTATHIAVGYERNFGFVPPMAIAVKHGNACGAGIGSGNNADVDTVKKAVMGDNRAIFGGSVMTNFMVDSRVAEALIHHGSTGRRLLDTIIAPSFTAEAVELLARKAGKCRLIENPALSNMDEASLDSQPRFRYVRGGFLRQPNYTYVLDFADDQHTWTGEMPIEGLTDYVLAWAICATSNSNTITLVRDGQLLANAVGQQDRVGCCELAIKRALDAGHSIVGAKAASDSFFPFPDGPEVLANAGVHGIWTTSGSVKDSATKEVGDRRKITLGWVPDAIGRGFFGH